MTERTPSSRLNRRSFLFGSAAALVAAPALPEFAMVLFPYGSSNAIGSEDFTARHSWGQSNGRWMMMGEQDYPGLSITDYRALVSQLIDSINEECNDILDADL